MNKVVLIGRVTKDIEVRATSNGRTFCRFTLAVDGFRKSDGTRDADFISIVAWNKAAELCGRALHKGDRVGIEGHINTGSYEKNGQTIRTTDVVVEKVEFLTPKNHNNAPQEQPQMTGNVTEDGFAEVDDDSLPF